MAARRLVASLLLCSIACAQHLSLDSLLVRLRTPNISVDDELLAGLAALGPEAAPAVPFLIEHLDHSWRVRETLAAIGSVGLRDPVAALRGAGPNLRLAVTYALADADEKPPHTVPALMGLLADDDARFRRALGKALGRHVSRLALLVSLDDVDDPRVKAGLVVGLGMAAEPAAAHAAEILDMLADPALVVQVESLRALGHLCTLPSGGSFQNSYFVDFAAALDLVLPQLCRSLSAQEAALREAAARGLHQILSRAPHRFDAELAPAVRHAALEPALLAALEDEVHAVRFHAALTLRRLPEPSGAGAQALVAALKDPSARVRELAARALQTSPGADTGATVCGLLEVVDDPSRPVHNASLFALQACGQAAAPALPRMLELAAQSETYHEAIGVLAAMGPQAVPALLERLYGSDAGWKRAAVYAFVTMDPIPALPPGPLLELLGADQPLLACQAALLLAHAEDVCAGEILPTLLAWLEAGWTTPTMYAALAALGNDAIPALPTLLRQADDLPFDRDPELYGCMLATAPSSRQVARALSAGLRAARLQIPVASVLGSGRAALSPALVEMLRDPDADERLLASWGVRALPALEGPMVDAIAEGLCGTDDPLRGQLLASLTTLGVEAAPLLPTLRDFANERRSRAWLQCVVAIGNPPALECLLEDVQERPGFVDGRLKALRGFHDVEDHILEQLSRLEPDASHPLLEVLAEVSSSPAASSLFLEHLMGHDPELRSLALDGLASSPVGPTHGDRMLNLLLWPNEEFRAIAVDRIGECGASVLEQVLALACGADGDITRAAREALPAFGPHAPEAFELLWERLRDPALPKACSEPIARTLVAMGRNSLRRVVRLLTGDERERAITVLAAGGEGEAVVALLRSGGTEAQAMGLLEALAQMNSVPRGAVEATTPWLQAPSALVRRQACITLSRGPRRENVVAALRAALDDEAKDVRVAAREALRAID